MSDEKLTRDELNDRSRAHFETSGRPMAISFVGLPHGADGRVDYAAYAEQIRASHAWAEQRIAHKATARESARSVASKPQQPKAARVVATPPAPSRSKEKPMPSRKNEVVTRALALAFKAADGPSDIKKKVVAMIDEALEMKDLDDDDRRALTRARKSLVASKEDSDDGDSDERAEERDEKRLCAIVSQLRAQESHGNHEAKKQLEYLRGIEVVDFSHNYVPPAARRERALERTERRQRLGLDPAVAGIRTNWRGTNEYGVIYASEQKK